MSKKIPDTKSKNRGVILFSRKIKKLVTAHIVGEYIYLAVGEKYENNKCKINNVTHLPLKGPAFADFVKANKLKNYPVYLVLGGKQIVTRIISIPKLPREEIRQALFWEVTKYIPIPSDELIFDFEELNLANNPNGEELQILIVAARKQYIENYCDILVNAGLQPIVVEVEGTVLKYLYSSMENANVSASVCCIYLDEQRGIFSFVTNNKLSFVHNVEWEQKTIITRLSSEYQRVNNYLQRQFGVANPSNIYLLGPLADEIPQENLQRELDLDVTKIDFTNNPHLLIQSQVVVTPDHTFSIGLILREVE
jgi:type IV pilus assembly protein PilM